MEPDERTMARLKAGCICKGVKLIRLIEAIENGATTFEQVAVVCGIGDGPCKGKRCGAKVQQLLLGVCRSMSQESRATNCSVESNILI